MQDLKHSSLRDTIIASIGNFLYEEGFQTDPITKNGILEMLDMLSDYHEEGNKLFPEVLVTNSLEFFKTIPNKEIIICSTTLSVDEFKRAVKLCAPLAVGNWIIFVEAAAGRIKYGLISAEMTETSPSIYDQTVGQLRVNYPRATIAFIRNLGQKTVELCGLKNRLIVSLNLEVPKEFSLNEIGELAKCVSSKIDEKIKVNATTFFLKLFDETLKQGHGNLLGIIEDDEQNIAKVKETLKVNGGVYLPQAIDFAELLMLSETTRDNESSTNIKAFSSILKGMINHDGIVIMTTKGKVLGYHLLIDSYLEATDTVDGGARSKAFVSMQKCDHFLCCFYKSQDGNIKLWTK